MIMAPIPKPSKLDRAVAAHARKLARAKAKRAKQAKAYRAWTKVRAVIYARDKGRCRACSAVVRVRSDAWWNLAHTHHLVYRSAGGTDDTANLVLLCGLCHDYEHAHRIQITGNGDGAIEVRR